MKTLIDLMLKNWKTTAVGITTFLSWVLINVLGIEVSTEIKEAFIAFMVSLGALFAKDGNVTHSK